MRNDRTHLHTCARVRLLDGLLRGRAPADLRRLCLVARWPLEGRFVVTAVVPKVEGTVPALDGLTRRHLVRIDDGSAVVVSAATATREVTG